MHKTILIAFSILTLSVLSDYGCYRKGSADAASKTAEDYKAEYGNDSNGDPSVAHSAIYALAYARGQATGGIEARQLDFTRCGEKLARVVVQTRDTRVAGQLLANHDIAPSQLKKAEDEWDEENAKPRHR